jgi:hypothetical protein
MRKLLSRITTNLGRAGLLFIAALFLVVSVNPPITAWADASTPSGPSSERDIRGYITESSWYDPTDVPCSLGGADGGLMGSDNAEIVFNFFRGKGLSAAQASGIIGNLQQESGIRPDTVQVIDGSAKGIAQWEGPRFDNLVKFAKEKGKSWGELGIQLEFMWHELSTYESRALTELKKTSTPAEAAKSFSDNYERPNKFHPNYAKGEANRVKFANQAFSRFGNRTAPSSSTDGGPCATDTEEAGKFIVYNQYDPRWARKPYGSTTIAEGGCGPSAMAMIVTALTGKRITPDITAAYAASQGMYIPGVGSSWAIAGVVARHYGLKSTLIRADSSRIIATLKAGGMVVTSGSGALPFTSGGHYIVIRGIDSDGRWLIGDSGHIATNRRSWPPSHLLSIMNDGNVYAITK